MKSERLQARLERLYARLDLGLGGRLSLAVRAVLAFDRDDGPLMARSIAYYALFATSPAVLALIVIISFVLEPEEVRESVMGLVARYLPGALDVVTANIDQLLNTRESVGLIALIGLLWSASGVFSAIFRAVNRAWGVPRSTLVLKDKLYGLVTMLAISLFFLVTLAVGPVVSLARTWQLPVLGRPAAAQPGIFRLVGWLSASVPVLLSIGVFILMYRTMPRTQVRWCDVWSGGLIAGLFWEVGQQLLAWYLANLTTHNLVYGSVGAVIAFVLWSYLGAQIFLLGAEFTAESSRWRRAGRPVETRPLSEWVADWSRVDS